MKTTSVTDLKANLSARLRRVQAGESFLVTDRQQPVALLQPVPSPAGEAWEVRLQAAGLLSAPAHTLDVAAFLALPKAKACASPKPPSPRVSPSAEARICGAFSVVTLEGRA